MTKFLAPLGIFIMGNLLLLVMFIFFPAIGTASDKLAEETAGFMGWGWQWAVSSTRLLVFLIAELVILFAVAKSFLSSRDR